MPTQLTDFDPISQLVVKRTDISKAKFPVIDVHTHLRKIDNRYAAASLVKTMDKLNFRMIFDLDGNFKEGFNRSLKYLAGPYPDRFTALCKIDLLTLDDADFAQKTTAYIRECHKRGARGMKFNSAKPLGLNFRFADGRPMVYDDPKLRPVWETCAELKMPCLLHIADPVAFWEPTNRFNERVEEIEAHPDGQGGSTYSYYGKNFPGFFQLLEAQEVMLEANRDTTFVIAHVGSYPENLGEVGRMLDDHPNMYIDTAQRIAELGRQPYTARKFLMDYQDRVLFGTDTTPDECISIPNFRFYETYDEYFHYDEYTGPEPATHPSEGHYGQGRWMIYGVGLPDDVLKKIYYQNAINLYNLPFTIS